MSVLYTNTNRSTQFIPCPSSPCVCLSHTVQGPQATPTYSSTPYHLPVYHSLANTHQEAGRWSDATLEPVLQELIHTGVSHILLCKQGARDMGEFQGSLWCVQGFEGTRTRQRSRMQHAHVALDSRDATTRRGHETEAMETPEECRALKAAQESSYIYPGAQEEGRVGACVQKPPPRVHLSSLTNLSTDRELRLSQ